MSNVIGATSWQVNGNIHLRVYSLQASGFLMERCWDTNSWYTGALTNKFKASTGANAASWLEGSTVHIRVYAIADGIIQEYCWDGSQWVAGAKLGASSQAPGVASWLDAKGLIHLRVYGYDAQGVQKEHCYDSDGKGWYIGAYSA